MYFNPERKMLPAPSSAQASRKSPPRTAARATFLFGVHTKIAIPRFFPKTSSFSFALAKVAPRSVKNPGFSLLFCQAKTLG